MRDINGDEWDWLRQGTLSTEPVMDTSTILTSRLVELLDAKRENEVLKCQVSELTLRIQKMGAAE